MDKELLAEIEALQQELKKAAAPDSEDYGLLSRVVGDVVSLHSEEAEVDETSAVEHHALRERLRELSTRFEVSHPQLAAAIERVANTLSSLGV